jgi:hypothetical protein
VFFERLGVSILSWSCLDQESRSQHFQEGCLNDRENLDTFKNLILTIEKFWFCLDITFQSQESQVRSRNPLRHEFFGQSWQFVSILIESELILSFFLIDISQFVEIFEPEVPHCLEKSWLSQFIHIVLMQILKSLNFKNLDWEKKCFLNMIDNLNNFQKLVAPLRTISISISIGLDCWDPQP